MEKKLAKLESEYRDFQMQEQIKGKTFEAAKMKSVQKFNAFIENAVTKISEEYGIDIVTTRSNTMYVSEKIQDITIEIVTELNQKLKNIEFDEFYTQIESDFLKSNPKK